MVKRVSTITSGGPVQPLKQHCIVRFGGFQGSSIPGGGLSGSAGAKKDQPVQDAGGGDLTTTIFLHVDPIGTSGVRNFSGYPAEEYFNTLKGHEAANVYDRMRRSESEIVMVLGALKNPIKGAKWDVEAGDPTDPQSVMIADFCKHVFFEDMDSPWDQYIQEAVSSIDFGFAPFEVLEKVVLNHPQWGNYNGIKSLAWRSPRTIYRWLLDPVSGKLRAVTQIAFGDLQRLVDIPAQHLMVISVGKEGDNYEGISMLRGAYGAFFRKQNYLKMQAIGIEKFAIPTPVGRIPDSRQNSQEAENFKQALAQLAAHERNFITLPSEPPASQGGGWGIDFTKNDFDPEKVQKTIDSEDKNMAKAVLAQFLELGMTTTGGSWSLAFNQSDFFKQGLEHVAKLLSEAVTQGPMKRVVDLNFGPQQKYPKITHSGISDEAGAELAKAMKDYCDAQIIIPDDELEEHIRNRMRLPKASPKGRRQVQAKGGMGIPATPLPPVDPNPPAPSDAEDSPSDVAGSGGFDAMASAVGGPAYSNVPEEKTAAQGPAFQTLAQTRRIALAEKKARAQIKAGGDGLVETIRGGLEGIAQSMIGQLMTAWKTAAPADKLNAARGLQPKGAKLLQGVLSQQLAEIAGNALTQARIEVPKAKNVQLSEGHAIVRLGSWQITMGPKKPTQLDDLPPRLRSKVSNKAQALADSLTGDLTKAVVFQFDASEPSTDSPTVLEADLTEATDDFIHTSSAVLAAAGNASSSIVNESRNTFFFDDAVKDQIESMTFDGGPPCCDLCDDLMGRTFAMDDPEAARFFPPLHHNCSHYLRPNLVGAKGNPSIDDAGLKPSDPGLEKHMTFSHSSHSGSRPIEGPSVQA